MRMLLKVRAAGAVLLGLAVVTFGAPEAEAWCVYNKTSQRIQASATSDQSRMAHTWQEEIAPGDSECCHWSDTGCNPGGKRDKDLTFWIYKAKTSSCNALQWLTGDCPAFDPSKSCDGKFKAGGYVVVQEGAGTKYDCGAYFDP